ncbi:thioredoxin family protein [Flammeovirga sp. MY04]|nr:thioredoxin family protein [Flammeovirga sp. MY04]
MDVEINKSNIYQIIRDKENIDMQLLKNSIVVFETPWSEVSQQILNYLKSFKNEYNFELVKVDLDKYRDLILEYEINELPTLIFINNKMKSTSMGGILSKEKLRRKLDENFTKK